jgi:hypothetical protein
VTHDPWVTAKFGEYCFEELEDTSNNIHRVSEYNYYNFSKDFVSQWKDGDQHSAKTAV